MSAPVALELGPCIYALSASAWAEALGLHWPSWPTHNHQYQPHQDSLMALLGPKSSGGGVEGTGGAGRGLGSPSTLVLQG